MNNVQNIASKILNKNGYIILTKGGKNMKKIFPIIILGLLLISALGTGISFGKDIKQEIQHSNPKNLKISNIRFEIEPKYSYIRSYPGGGGIFIIKMTPKIGFSGYISLQINADPNLNAQLNKEKLDKQSQVAELTIQPDESTEIKIHEIVIKATYHKKAKAAKSLDWINKIKFPILSYLINRLFNRNNEDSGGNYLSNIDETLVLEIEMINWTSENLANAIIKRNDLVDWLEADHPEFGTFSGENSFAYVTYPAHLIVEHWTFLYEKWEMRICFHVTIPPHNWSMVWLRPRGEIDAVFAAKREYNGTAYEIPVEDYPTYYGY